jgi:hypothetical protein
MPVKERIQALHERMYEQSLVFLALKTHPDREARPAETRQRIIQIYRKIRTQA